MILLLKRGLIQLVAECSQCGTFALLFSLLLTMNRCLAADSAGPIDSFGPCKDGADFASTLQATVKKWGDYTCDSELWVYKPDKTTKSSCKFFYKDNSVRIQVTGGGFRDGSVVVRTKDGSVKAHGGGMLGFMTMNLDPDSRMLILPNGTNVTRTDLPTVLSDIMTQLGAGYKSRVTSGPVDSPDIAKKFFLWEEYEPGDALPVRRIFWAAEDKVPIRIDLYKAGKRVSSAWFKNVSPNAGVSAELFKL
jgi:outer membrane lipoprotein-sorting protein